ncbi:transcriptional regulator, LuxR family protein [Microseira wollei NIES-4236]|uniref:Transcriptional regulator, LuxR family protein n=2 Tax=Microseira wollei TaxID=467598 RepID=A0AAV3WPP4_9CYAN|nr:LuxR C-terminal-related transcriptional regulator [Microseira wollei]GET44064.1 transcriptional regulator, LuxR family protein [Microseira wollei NIES-4236]
MNFVNGVMAESLQSLFEAISQVRDEESLRSRIMVRVGNYFAAKRWSLFFYEELPPVPMQNSSLFKLALSLEHNPVLRYLVERHAPVHEELLLPPGLWETICPLADHGHVMAGPIVSQGRLVGAIGLTRERGTAAFDAHNLNDLSAICLHLSTRLVTIKYLGSQFNSPKINRLTPRELQIASLVAKGLTNAQIGAELWITENSVKQALKRMFRKLEVSSRSEMVAQLCSH